MVPNFVIILSGLSFDLVITTNQSPCFLWQVLTDDSHSALVRSLKFIVASE